LGKRPGIFYGWFIVFGLSLVAGVSMSMAGPNYTLFIKPMADELGFSQAVFGWSVTVRLVAMAAFSPLLGPLLDRLGARGPLAVAGGVMGLAVIGLSLVSQPWHLIGLFAIMGLTGIQGGGMLYVSVPIAKWFIRRRGLAMSLGFIGGPIGFTLAVPLEQLLIDSIGWRDTWLILGSTGGIVTVLVALLVVRRRPEDMGLLPDGERRPRSDDAPVVSSRPIEQYQYTRREAIHTRAFWLLAIAFGFQFFAGSAVGVFRVPFFQEKGFDPQVIALGLSVDAFSALLGALGVGFFLDRLSARYIGLAGFISLGLSVLLTITVGSTLQMFAASALLGLGFSILVVTQNQVWPNYFGRAHVGSIRGAALPVTFSLAAISAPLTGMFKDMTGEYFIAWWIALAGLAVAALLIFIVRPPTRMLAGASPTPTSA